MSKSLHIPAGTISVDLKKKSKSYSREVKEIRRLDDLKDKGEATDEEFCRLVKLLCCIGEKYDAEYLLRRNLEMDGKSHKLYFRLFGNVIEKEFESAINSFKKEFGVSLKFVKHHYGFLDKEYNSVPIKNKKRKYKLLSENCVIRFNCSHKTGVEADVAIAPDKETLTAAEFLLLYWYKGVWLTEEEYFKRDS